MTIYFDCSSIINWSGNFTGIPRTVYCLAKALLEQRSSFQFIATNDKLGAFHLLSGQPSSFEWGDVAKISKNDVILSAGATWSDQLYQKKVREIKNHGGKYYQVFYDLIPAAFPYFYEDGCGFGYYYLDWNKDTFSLCDGAFSISSSTKQDMVTHFNLSEEEASRIRVIRLGEDHINLDTAEDGDASLSLKSNFLLSVGTIEIRKNHVCLINAYRILTQIFGDDLPELIIVGREGWNDGGISYQIANDPILKNFIHVETNISDKNMKWLYQNCLFTLYPSYYEGWGLPVAESFLNGRPCICSGVSGMLEIAPELTIFASPYCVEDWIAAISYLLEHPMELERYAKRIRKNYRPTSWDVTLNSMLKLF